MNWVRRDGRRTGEFVMPKMVSDASARMALRAVIRCTHPTVDTDLAAANTENTAHQVSAVDRSLDCVYRLRANQQLAAYGKTSSVRSPLHAL